MVLGIQHLVRTGETRLIESLEVELAYCYESLEHISVGVRIRLVQHALIAIPGGTRLVGVYSRHNHYLVSHLLLHAAQAGDIIYHRILPVGGAGTYHQQKLVALAGKDVADGCIVFLLGLRPLVRERVHLLDFLRYNKLALEIHIHNMSS